MRKIPAWIWVTGAIVGVWYLSKPKTVSGVAATGAAPAGSSLTSGGLDAGRAPHGHHHHIHHGRGPRGFVGHSVDVYDYAQPLIVECDPRFPCAQQPILPCRCG